MAFVRYKGKTKIMYFKKGDTLEEVRDGSLVTLTDSGTVRRCQNDSTDRPIGVCRANDTVADTQFNSDGTHGNAPVGYVPIEVPVENAVEWLIDVDSDCGAADTDIGCFVAIDTLGGASLSAGDSCSMRVDISDTGMRHVFVTGRVSAQKIIGTIAKTAWNYDFDSFDTSR